MKPNLIIFPGGFVANGMKEWPLNAHLYSHTHRMLREAKVGDTVDIAFRSEFFPFNARLRRCTVVQALDGSWWLVENREQPKLRLHRRSM